MISPFFIGFLTSPFLFILSIIIKTIARIYRLNLLSNNCRTKTAASVIRERNALGLIPAEVQKILREASSNLPNLLEQYKSLSPQEQLDFTKKLAPDYFSPIIRKGKIQKPNPNFRTTAFTPEEYGKYLSKNKLPPVLQAVEGLERGTINLIKKHNLYPLEFNTADSEEATIMLGNLLFGNKINFLNKTRNPFQSYGVPEVVAQQKTRSLLKNSKNVKSPSKEELNNFAQYIYHGNQPGCTFIKAPVNCRVSEDSMKSYLNKLVDIVDEELEKYMKIYVNPNWGTYEDKLKLAKCLDIGIDSDIMYEGVPVKRIIAAILARHEVMESISKNRIISKNKKGNLFSLGMPWAIDYTSHNSPEVIADEIMNLNSIFGHPVNNNLFRTIRAEENLKSPSYKALGFNYTDSSKPSIVGDSRKDVMRRARKFADKELTPLASISSPDINDFINSVNLYYPKNFDENLYRNIKNDYTTFKGNLASQSEDKGKSILNNVFSIFK